MGSGLRWPKGLRLASWRDLGGMVETAADADADDDRRAMLAAGLQHAASMMNFSINK